MYMKPMLDFIKMNNDIWNHFTKEEEYCPEKLDNYGRFCGKYSKYTDPSIPSVSRYLINKGFKFIYPNEKKFAIILTHDVDNIYPPYKHEMFSIYYKLINKNYKKLFSESLWRLKGREFSPYLNFETIQNIERKYSAKSSFYFLANSRDPQGYRYDIHEIEDEIDGILKRGNEIGLHGGYYSYNSSNDIYKEKKIIENIIGKPISGCRIHYLRFRVPETWKMLAKAGFKYDTTFGYNDKIGFRNGMCHPFRPFDLNTNSIINILEIPLNIMDMTLLFYIRSIDTSLSCIENLINTVENYNGVLTILWHNSFFECLFREEWAELYEKILNIGFMKNAWITSAEEFAEWWLASYHGKEEVKINVCPKKM